MKKTIWICDVDGSQATNEEEFNKKFVNNHADTDSYFKTSIPGELLVNDKKFKFEINLESEEISHISKSALNKILKTISESMMKSNENNEFKNSDH